MKIHYNFSFSFTRVRVSMENRKYSSLYLFGSFLFPKIRGLISEINDFLLRYKMVYRQIRIMNDVS